MIRRDVSAVGSDANRWALISQIEHAHLAGRLAEQWGASPFAPLVPRDELVWAIHHHDDGWRDWDQAPDVDPATGIPRSFTEMPIADTMAIWSGSIDGAAAKGKLQGYLVAGHFCTLGRRAGSWHLNDPDWAEMDRFLTAYEVRMRDWREAWESQQAANTEAVAEAALACLRFFDMLSLWFCCAEATGPDVVATPEGVELTIGPESPASLARPQHVRLSPWPLWVGEMNLEVPARLVPAVRYESQQALATAPSESVLLRWTLVP